MNDEQINITIAEAYPDKFRNDIWIRYMNELVDEGSLLGIRATARQRAEAFLWTLGKWEEAE